VKSSHGEFVTKVKKRDSELVTCDEFTVWRVHWHPREIRYLGSYLTAGRQFRCSVSYAKRSFHRATNAIFGKISRFVSEEVL